MKLKKAEDKQYREKERKHREKDCSEEEEILMIFNSPQQLEESDSDDISEGQKEAVRLINKICDWPACGLSEAVDREEVSKDI